MSQEQIERIVKELRLIRADVNILRGDFTTHQTRACEHWKNNSAFQEEMRPLLDTLRFVQTFQRFLKWGGLTLFAFFAALYYFIRRP